MLLTSITRYLLAAATLFVTATAPAQDNAKPVDPQRLIALLPSAWDGVKCGAPETERVSLGVSESRASVACKGTPASGDSRFEVSLTVIDLGSNGAKYYVQAARYLREDTKSDSQHRLTLDGNRLAEFTSYTEDSMDIDTYIAPRLVAKAHCMSSTEAKCKSTLERFDFKKLEAFQP